MLICDPCNTCCPTQTTKLCVALCGRSRISAKLRDTSSVSSGNDGDPFGLLMAVQVLLIGILCSFILPVKYAAPVTVGVLVLICFYWWWTFRVYVSLSIPGGNWFGGGYHRLSRRDLGIFLMRQLSDLRYFSEVMILEHFRLQMKSKPMWKMPLTATYMKHRKYPVVRR